MTPSPVKAAALELGIPVRTPERVTEIESEIRSSDAKLGVVVAFGQILKPSVLAAVPGGFLNLHFSLLPRWRGAAPVERAILAGDQETGVCLMQLDPGMDTGPVLARRSVTIGIEETAGELSNRLVGLGTDLLVTSLDELGDAHARTASRWGHNGGATHRCGVRIGLDPTRRGAGAVRPSR